MEISSLALQFVLEGRDHCELAASGLLNLEKHSHDPEVINGIFRSFHTIKGTSGIFPEYLAITTLTHAAEELMVLIRNGEKTIDSESTDLFLAVLDQVGAWLDIVESTGEIPGDAQDKSAQLRAALQNMAGAADSGSTPDLVPLTEASEATETHPHETLLRAWLDALEPSCKETLRSTDAALTAFCYVPVSDAFFFGDDPIALIHTIPDLLLFEIVRQSDAPFDENYDPFVCDLRFMAVAAVDSAAVRNVFAYVEDQLTLLPCSCDLLEKVPTPFSPRTIIPPGPPGPNQEGVSSCTAESAVKKDASIRVNQEQLTALLDLAGRMIVVRNSLQYLAKLAATIYGAPQLAEEINLQHGFLNDIVERLQNIATEMREQPVSRVFERFPRLVRDLSRKLGKQVNLVMTGGETAAGKDIIDLLGDALIHLVRNSLDHGLETPAERTAAGKTEEGTITLRAFQDITGLVIEVEDNGCGVDPTRIRRKAVEKGAISAETAAAMSDEEALQLIMLPGFSTADTVSELSGRGVGMDAVLNIVASSGGSIRVFSTPGQGSRMRLTLPIHMAVDVPLIAWQDELTSRRF